MLTTLFKLDYLTLCYISGKTFVLFGKDSSVQNIGIVPNAINWLYRSINELRDHQKIRLFVRVSAIEVYGRSEKLKDLLVGFCEGKFCLLGLLSL